jgi:hypothetical protein
MKQCLLAFVLKVTLSWAHLKGKSFHKTNSQTPRQEYHYEIYASNQEILISGFVIHGNSIRGFIKFLIFEEALNL